MNIATLELQLEDWHRRKFSIGPNLPATIRKLGEELGELHEAMMSGNDSHVAEEAADVLFVMCHIVRFHCGTGALNRAVVDKLGVINQRLEGRDTDAV